MSEDQVQDQDQETEESEQDYIDFSPEEVAQHVLKPTELACVWTTQGPCSKKIYEAKLFENEIGVPACERHIRDHENTLILFHNGYDLQEVIDKGYEYRREQVYLLKLSGLYKGDVKF